MPLSPQRSTHTKPRGARHRVAQMGYYFSSGHQVIEIIAQALSEVRSQPRNKTATPVPRDAE